MEHYYALIMAGGGGTRLWPLSRKQNPKQILALTETDSLFRSSVLRLAPLFTPDHIYVVTGRQYVDQLRAEAPEIPEANFIAEPFGKNTGPAVGLAMTVIQKHDPQATIAILTADHHISKKAYFRDILEIACQEAQGDRIVTLGISPTYPATGFGYIHHGEKLTEGKITVYEARGFREKPDRVRAAEFLESGEYSWNSGMFICTVATIMAEFERQQPSLMTQLQTLKPFINTPEFAGKLTEIWQAVQPVSIDHAIMEGARHMAVIPADIGWSDVGSWDALYEVLPSDEDGNCYKVSGARPLIFDSNNTLVFSDRLVAVVGVDDLVIIDSDDALLICRKGRSQDVRDIVQHLRDTKQDPYL